jgi:hypothetical protein
MGLVVGTRRGEGPLAPTVKFDMNRDFFSLKNPEALAIQLIKKEKVAHVHATFSKRLLVLKTLLRPTLNF